EVDLHCPVSSIPEAIVLNIAHLDLGKTLTAGDLPLPLGAKLNTPADIVVVGCHLPLQAADDTAAGVAEPEIIGKVDKKDEADD
ncbi:MAG TPA: 50S ribosomal protein L25, partial [Pirellulaceae bacterium]